jgi:hypothetical protein
VLHTTENIPFNKATKVTLDAIAGKPFFESVPIKLQLAYGGTDDDVFTVANYTVMKTPDTVPAAKINAEKRAKIGSDTIVQVQFGEQTKQGLVNDSSKLGVWQLRLAKVNAADRSLTPVTEFQTVPETGELSLTVPVNAELVSSNLVLESRLVTQVEQFAKTLQSANFRINEYVWPSFETKLRMPILFAPTDARVLVVPSDKRFAAQSVEKDYKATYTWSLPAGVIAKKIDGPTAFLNFENSGTYTVQVNISDVKGSTATLTKEIQVAEPAPYSADLRLFSANRWPERAPAEFSLRPNINGGHPKDKITNYELLINDESKYIGEKSPRLLNFDSAGNYDIKLKINSKMGASQEFTKSIVLNPNQPPVCTTTQRSFVKMSKNYGTVTAKCTDADGRIAAYKWNIDGNTISANRSSLTFEITGTSASAQVIAVDDAGAETVMNQTVNPM